MQLIVTAISKDYGDIAAVRQVSFQINSGDIFALLGPNGAGKSSIIRMLVGMTRPDSGSILVSHQQEHYDHVPRRLLGYLPEDRGLYPDKSIEKNLLYLAQLHGLTKQKALQEMAHWLDVFELTERRSEDLKQLSKGNQQKVQLIAAVLHQPALVILDEPFSGLDPINQEKVVTFLKALKARGMTVILSAHQMAMVEKLADHMLLMAQGKAILAGTLADIKQQAGSQRQMVISCAGPVVAEQLQQWLPELEIDMQSSTRFVLKLTAAQNVSAILQQLVSQIELTQVEMQTADLHQLYLTAMAEHQLREQA
ncbi:MULTISPECIES: ABC transporter ATP-binding protein [unclassified Arsukibacterium]|uniref:ABC transporter ATP-binding protein n=1 Tax=unclassified Arsukibacterium TaxID=2635278 RepID=UPI000C64E3B4|nr:MULTISPECIES: ATP-binding cassette domain-containing protein [unclassified Arsukibacterium]MAA93091.1 ABC transporter ATP-binding protein [Rheinheimera sp.]MBM35520.1 ABC transporter ATP-binding protein [Rheinheimera sp.]|tara:strand:- start:90074 stop:91003 length:930 start_codon:yes stop_codon:yes gene_type:complete